MGIFGHGCAHLYLALKDEKPNGASPAERYTGDPKGIIKVYIFLSLFWFGFMRGIFGGEASQLLKVGVALFFSTIHVFLVPGKFGFSYVALGLTCTYIFRTLTNPKKDKYYNALSIALAPVGIVGLWAEGLMCE